MHRIIHELHSVRRISPREMPKSSSVHTANGLRYERRLKQELEFLASHNDVRVIHNPWFEYEDAAGYGICVPDFLVQDRNTENIVIIESKLTYVPNAIHKLLDLYLPIVQEAMSAPAVPLVVCKTMTPQTPRAGFTISEALMLETPLLHWLGHGHLRWQ